MPRGAAWAEERLSFDAPIHSLDDVDDCDRAALAHIKLPRSSHASMHSSSLRTVPKRDRLDVEPARLDRQVVDVVERVDRRVEAQPSPPHAAPRGNSPSSHASSITTSGTIRRRRGTARIGCEVDASSRGNTP